MVTRARRQREKHKKALEDAAKNVTPHIKKLKGRTSLNEQCLGGIPGWYDFKGVTYDEQGEAIAPKEWGKAGGAATKQSADERLLKLKEQFADWWGDTSKIRFIAKRSRLSENTIRNYFKRGP